MKKYILSIFLIVICYIGYGQYTITQNLGSPSTLVKNPNYGGLQGGLIPYTFTDTSQANTLATALKTYCGAFIYTTDISALWYRSCYGGNNQWIQIQPAGSPSGQNPWIIGGNSGLFTSPVDPQYVGTNTSQGFGFKSNNTVRLTLSTAGAWGLGAGLDYGTSGYVLTSQGNAAAPVWAAASGGSIPISSLTAATATNSINNANYAQQWNWNSFDANGNPALQLTANTTATVDGNTGLFEVVVQGANAASGVTSVSSLFSNIHTGTTSTNIAGYFVATSGSNNYAIIVPPNSGSVGIGNSTPSSLLSLGTSGSQLGTLSMAGNTSGTITIQPQAAAGTYNFNLPTTAGTSGYLLTSAGGVGSPMTWTAPSALYPTWQQTLTAGSTLTGDNTVAGAGYSLNFDNNLQFTASGELVQLVGTSGGKSSSISVLGDSLDFHPYLGVFSIDTLNYSANADDSMVVWSNANGGAVGMRAIPSGGGGANTALSNLASVAINTSLISDANNTDDLGTSALAWRTGYFGTSVFSPLIVGGTGTTSDLNLKTTSGVGASGADMHFLVGNNGATEAMTILNNGAVGVNTTTPGVVNGTTFASVKLQISNASASSYITTNTDLNIGGTGILFNRSAASANLRLWAMDSQPDLSNTSSKFTVSSYTDAGSPTNMLTIDRNAIMGLRIPAVTTQYDNTTTTLGNVTGLTYNVTAAKKYKFEARLYTTSDVAGGIKVAIGGTATATSIIYEGLTTDAGLTTQGRATALGTAVAGVTAVTAAYVTITGVIVVNASGTLTVQAAANVATGTTSILVGSTFQLTEIL